MNLWGSAAIGGAYGYYAGLQAQTAQQEAAARAQAWNQQAAMGYGNAYQSPWGQTGQDCLRQLAAISKPCPYCKRTKQTPGHQSCDGCGAPR